MIVEGYNIEKLKERVAVKFGYMPKTPTDFNLLAVDIFKRTNRPLSVSTLKRIWGYIPSSHGTSYSSLTVLCRYIGFPDWDVFCSQMSKADDSVNTSGFDKEYVLVMSTLDIGAIVRMDWDEDKSCTLKKLEHPNRFEVISSNHIKIIKGDTGMIDSLSVGRPFIMSNCSRNGSKLGTYSGANTNGLKSITLL